jgi:hypothetical protein
MDQTNTITNPTASIDAHTDLVFALTNCPPTCPKALRDAKNELTRQFLSKSPFAFTFTKKSLLEELTLLHDMRYNEILAPDTAWERTFAETWEALSATVLGLAVDDGTLLDRDELYLALKAATMGRVSATIGQEEGPLCMMIWFGIGLAVVAQRAEEEAAMDALVSGLAIGGQRSADVDDLADGLMGW